jgi:hypothetical protein
MTKLHWIPFLALAVLLSATSWAQSAGERTSGPQGTPVTLWMDWTRGGSHYGADFIHLHRRCEVRTDHACECVADFKVISSKENSKEFADYVASFDHGKVPVIYSVFFNDRGQVLAARLVSVGDWRTDKFQHNDGLLGVELTFSGKGKIGQTQQVPDHGISDCFPSEQR